jgi:hypothetical protein
LYYQLPHWVWPTALMTVCALAVWRGNDDERLAAGGLLTNWAFTMMLTRATAGVASGGPQWEVLLLDAALLGLYLWIALRSARFWPLFAAAFALLLVVTHLGRVVDPRVSGWAYLTGGLVFAYLMLFAIGYGAWTAARYASQIRS